MTANITPLAPARERREQMVQQWRDSVRLDASHEMFIVAGSIGAALLEAAGEGKARWRQDLLPEARQLAVLRKALGDLSAALGAYMDAGSEPCPVADGG